MYVHRRCWRRSWPHPGLPRSGSPAPVAPLTCRSASRIGVARWSETRSCDASESRRGGLKIFAPIHGVLCIQWDSRGHEYREKKSTVNKLPKPRAAQRTLPAIKGDSPHCLWTGLAAPRLALCLVPACSSLAVPGSSAMIASGLAFALLSRLAIVSAADSHCKLCFFNMRPN